ncbi:MAG: hypothetical protein ACYTGZ_10160 [Planctomycetota bacterium]
MEEQVRRLHEEFVAERETALAEAFRRQRRDLRNAVMAGAFVGLLSTFVTATVTRRAIFWHSYLLESLLGALAGYLLVRLRPDPLGGVILFGAAYMLAWLIRAIGFDPSVLFAVGDIGGAAMIQGNMVSLSLCVACGAAMGHVMRD